MSSITKTPQRSGVKKAGILSAAKRSLSTSLHDGKGSGSGSNVDDEAEDVSPLLPDNISTSEHFGIDNERQQVDGPKDGVAPPPCTTSSLKKLQRRVRVSRIGSLLHRNTDREDHLRHLFLKRRISEAILASIQEDSNEPSTTVRQLDFKELETIESSNDKGYELSLFRDSKDDNDDATMMKWDETFLKEIRTEVEEEMEKENVSARIREINDIYKDYRNSFQGLNQFPLEVRMNEYTYTVPVDESTTKIQTVYNSSFLYPVFRAIRRLVTNEKKIIKPIQYKNILNNISLVLKPGKQYLVLGPPGSGKSTLLRAIAGLVRPTHDESVQGSIMYNGRTLEQSDGYHIDNAFAYIDQLDQHAPRLTVEETFEFAFQCLTGGKFVRQIVFSQEVEDACKRADKEHLATKLVMAALGLNDVKDTFVGDTNIRGVSGGQRRRVTVGEMLMSQAPVLCGDEISTGLDASTTYEMVQVILHYGRAQEKSRIFALLQPSPETVSLFDEVIVLSEGNITYAGPIEEVDDYFAGIGYQCPEFTDVADFLQMISTEDGVELYNPNPELRQIRPVPPTPIELAEIFRESKFGTKIRNILDSPPPFVWNEIESSHHGGEISALVMSDAVRKKYANHFPKSTCLIFWRFIKLWLRDKRVIIAGAVKNILMGVSVGGVFFDTVDPLSIQGALFQAGLFIMLGSMQSSSSLLQDRIIYYKHTDANFYSAWPFVFGRSLSQFPQTMADTITFATLLYFVIGLADREDPVNYFVYLAILITFAILMNAQMSLFASFADGGTFQVFSSCTLLAMMLFGGFIIPPDSIPDYYLWLYWWNPFAWAHRALVVNEFRSNRWENPDQVLSDAGFVDPLGETYGQVWVAYSFLYMVPYLLLCFVLSAIGLTSVRHGALASPEPVKGEDTSTSDAKSKEKIPFTPVTLTCHDICYEVQASTTNETLKLLKNVNGIFRPGRMCALMGSSGAGKTTLMDVIALRKRSGTIKGEVRLNGWLQEPKSFRRCSGYVEQFDVQSSELTVRETVLFSARLRLDPDLVKSDENKKAFVDDLLHDVELFDLANALVGLDEGFGLSFEQKKRLSIAVELAASPSILFLDEPTSGLDARSALLVVKTLRKIADGNRTVCATIHQPSSAVFGMFDDLLLLKKGGEVVYHGPLGHQCKSLVAYFESKGAPRIDLGENPANWMLRVMSSEDQKDLADVYRKSLESEDLIQELNAIKESPDESLKIEFSSEFAVPAGRRRALINERLQKIYWRSPTYNLARIMVSLLIAFILGSVFLSRRNVDVFNEADLRAQLAVVFIGFIITGIMAILSVLPVMTRFRDMFYRHRDAGMYDSASMGLALGVAEKWFIVLSTALFCVVFIATSNLGNGIVGLISFWGFFTFNFAIYSYMGQLFVCLVKPTATALILCSVFIGINNFFAGLIVRPQFMVGGFYALPYYICPGHYVYESMVMSLYFENDHPVRANVGSEFYEYLVEDEDNACTEGSINCIGTSYQFADVYFGGEFQRDHTLRNALILGGILVLARVLTWIALKYIRFAK